MIAAHLWRSLASPGKLSLVINPKSAKALSAVEETSIVLLARCLGPRVCGAYPVNATDLVRYSAGAHSFVKFSGGTSEKGCEFLRGN
jgi:hypothetical protein